MYLSQSSKGIQINPTVIPPVPEFAWGYAVDPDGTVITGGRGLDPIYVTNLNRTGAGSLSAAMTSRW